MLKTGYRVDCHTHLWRYPGELTDELARETFIMRNILYRDTLGLLGLSDTAT